MAPFAAQLPVSPSLPSNQNPREEILLVQLAFSVVAKMPKPSTSAELLEAAKLVQVTGNFDDPTINAIRALLVERRSFRERSSMNVPVPPSSVTAMVLAFLATSI